MKYRFMHKENDLKIETDNLVYLTEGSVCCHPMDGFFNTGLS